MPTLASGSSRFARAGMTSRTILLVPTITTMLTAGRNTVRHHLGCRGGMFGRLAALDPQIFDLSGYTAWAGMRRTPAFTACPTATAQLRCDRRSRIRRV